MEPEMKHLFLRNHILLGVTFGLFLAAITYGFLTLIFGSFTSGVPLVSDPRNMLLISWAPNLILMRFYFVSLKLEKTGIGLLILTFAGVLLTFILFK